MYIRTWSCTQVGNSSDAFEDVVFFIQMQQLGVENCRGVEKRKKSAQVSPMT